MKTYDASVIARLEAGEVDYLDALTFFFDSGDVSFFLGGPGSFDWSDSAVGNQTFTGAGALISFDQVPLSQGTVAGPVVVALNETHLPEGSDTPVNIFDNGTRAQIDEEPWEGRTVILSCFWRDAGGAIIFREQIDVRQLDRVWRERDTDGNEQLKGRLELPDIIQRAIEGKTQNADLQAQIDAADTGFAQAANTVTQKIYFGRATPKTATSS